ncbi:MAG: lipopolysaccharide biosynthesis protein [Pseudomonadota bacterium]
MDWTSRVIASLKWSASARLASQLLSWLATLVVIRLLAVTDYGLMAIAMIFIGLAEIVKDLGLTQAIIQRTAVSDAQLAAARGFTILTGVFLFALLFVAARPIAAFFDAPNAVAVLRVLAVQFLFMPLGIIEYAMLSRALDFKRISLVELVASLCGIGVSLGLALAGAGVWALVGASVTRQVLNSLGYWRSQPVKVGVSFRLSLVVPLLRFGMLMSVNRLAWMLKGSLVNLFIGKLLSTEALGRYTVARDLSTLPVARVMPILNGVLFPAFSSIQDDPQRIARSLAFTAGAALTFFIPLLWGLAMVAPVFVPLVLGAQWVGAVPVLQILSAFVPVAAPTFLLPAIFNARGMPQRSLEMVLAGGGLTLAAILIAYPYGLEGIALAMGLADSCLLVFALYRVAGVIAIRRRVLLRAMWPAFAAGAVMAAALFGLDRVVDRWPNPILELGAKIALGGLVYCLARWLFDRKSVAHYVQLVRRRAAPPVNGL